jgi:NADH dehydrogenase FAD-containing subunit
MSGDSGRRRVVIVGGGFAGLFAARALRRSHVSVTLIDRAQHHLFQPLLYQCATGILSEGEIAVPLRDLLKRHKNVDCVMAEVVDVDAAGQRVTAQRVGGERLEFGYDDLIVAAGVRQSYFGHDEYAGWAPGMKTLSDALAIRRRVFGAFEMADTAADPQERRNWLTFALVGAGRRVGRRASAGESAAAPDKPFRYRDLGSAAYISRGRAVVSAGPLQLGGFIAWWIWLFIHIAFLTGYRNRAAAVLTWWLAFTRDSRRERAFTVQEVKTFRDVYAHPLAPEQPGGPSVSPGGGGARRAPGA